MFNLKFYYCTHCKNIAVKAVDKGVPMMCCGEKMVELAPGSVDAATEKHVPVATVSGNTVAVEVGEVAHPMDDDHSILFIALETTAGFQLARLAPGEPPEASFALADGTRAVAAYAYCDKHGLWAAEI